MQNLIPEIAPLKYAGQKVVTTKQLTSLFGCARQNIDSIFRNHKAEFVENVDYFYLTKETLKEFKKNLAGSQGCLLAGSQGCSPAGSQNCSLAGSQDCLPFSKLASVLYIWTKTGASKLSEYVGTERAKQIYIALKMGYFQIEPTPPKIETSNESATPKSDNNFAKVDRLIKLAEMATDNALRDELIQRAAALI